MPTGAIPSHLDPLEYQRARSEESADDGSADVKFVPRRHKRGNFMACVLVIFAVILLGAVLFSISTRAWSEQNTRAESEVAQHHHNRHHTHQNYSTRASCDCGASTTEARAMGCKYDTLAASWLPDACRDDELSREFDVAGPDGYWTYFADQGQTHALTLEELALLPDGNNCFWVTQRWHLLHCTFYWKKLHRQRLTGVTIERHYDRLGHINHCEMLLLNSGNLEEIVTEAAVGLSGDRLELGSSGGCPPDKEKAKSG